MITAVGEIPSRQASQTWLTHTFNVAAEQAMDDMILVHGIPSLVNVLRPGCFHGVTIVQALVPGNGWTSLAERVYWSNPASTTLPCPVTIYQRGRWQQLRIDILLLD